MIDRTPQRGGIIAGLRRRWRQRHLVTICVPAYKAEGFIAETLQSIAAQSYRNLKVLISVDPSGDGTERACRPFLADPRFTMMAQPRRLGWPGNVNYLLDQVRSRHFCIIFHDDLIEPNYIARLMRPLRRSKSVICAYPLLRRFGAEPSESRISTIAGDRFARALAYLQQPLNAVALRGLTRSTALDRGLRLREMETGGFFAEFLWVFELALLGDCKRVGRTFYHSRFRADSVSNGWRDWSAERKRAGWREVLRALNRIVISQGFTAEQEQRLLEAALIWAYQLGVWLPASAEEWSAIQDPAQRAALARQWRGNSAGYPPLP